MRLEEKETTGGITQEEIRRVAGQVRDGDKIEWKVITYTFDGKTKPREREDIQHYICGACSGEPGGECAGNGNAPGVGAG